MREEHRETHAEMAHTNTRSHGGHEDHAAMGRAGTGHDMHDMKPDVTRPSSR